MDIVNPNPVVTVTLEFQDGSSLRWKLSKPIYQFDAFWELGKLAGKYNLGIDFDLPEPRPHD